MIDSSARADERGLSLVELLITLAIFALVAMTAALYSTDSIARARGREESYKLLSFLQTARMEAVSRNRACTFVLDTAGRTIRVMDSAGTSDPSDDTILTQVALDKRVTFTSPVSGPGPITLVSGSGATWLATFSPEGTVPGGAGFVSIKSGSRFDRVTLFAAGAAKVERWTGSAWSQGS